MKRYIILGHENPDNDSIVSGFLLEKLLRKNNYDAEFIIPDQEISKENIILANFVGIDPTKYQKPLPKDKEVKYILVDHCKRDVPGEITAIIDHHPTDNPTNCLYYRNENACSTSCMIVKNKENYFSTDDIKAACFAAMVDTAAFHSSKTTSQDYYWVKAMCSKYKIDYDTLLSTSISPTDMSDLHNASLNGLKKYIFDKHHIASSYIHLENPTKNKEDIITIISYLQEYTKQENYDLFAFIVHDITNFKTRLYKIKKDSIETIDYNKYTERGNKIISDIHNELNQFQKKKTTQ